MEIVKQNFNFFLNREKGFSFVFLFAFIAFFFEQSSFASKQKVGLSLESATIEKQNVNVGPKSSTVEKQNSSPKKNLIETVNVSNNKIKNPNQKKEDAKEKSSSYSFRPLLIQGKKHLIQKTKDMKVDSGNIAESKLFFIDIDFKKRIFGHEEER